MKLKLIKEQAKQNWAILFCAFFIMMKWLDNLPKLDELTQYNEFKWILNYSMGLIPRGLLGTFLLPIKYFTAMDFAIIFAFSTLIFVVTYIAFCIWIIRGALERRVSEYWILLMTFLPMTIGNIFPTLHYGDTDCWLIMVLLINAWLLTTQKRGAILISTLLAIIGMLIHSSYVFLFFAGTFNLLIWLYWKTKKKSYLAAAIFDTAVLAVLLLYFSFSFGNLILFIPYENIESYITGRTSEVMDYAISLIPLTFAANTNIAMNSYKQDLSYFVVHETIVFYLLMLPVITWIFAFWRKCYKRMGSPKIFWFFALSLLSVLPAHMYQSDHGRWMAGPFFSQLVFMFSVLNYNDSNEERRIFTEIFDEKTVTYRWGLLLYLLVFEPVGIITTSRPVHRILLAIRTFFAKLASII